MWGNYIGSTGGCGEIIGPFHHTFKAETHNAERVMVFFFSCKFSRCNFFKTTRTSLVRPKFRYLRHVKKKKLEYCNNITTYYTITFG